MKCRRTSVLAFGFPLLIAALVVAPPQKPVQETKIPALELREGQPEGAFPAILTPQFVTEERAQIAPDSYVVGAVRNGGESHAYSLGLLETHEAVNDSLGGTPVVVAYCSLCDSAVAYNRRTSAGVLTFTVSGWLWRNAQTLRDLETGSLWTHLTGEAISGPLKGTRLTPFSGAIQRVRWQIWKEQHPNTQVLSVGGIEDEAFTRYAEYRRNPNEFGFYPPPFLDSRLPPKEKVLGIAVGAQARAYRLSAFLQTPLLTDTLNGKRFLLYRNPTNGTIAAWEVPRVGVKRPFPYRFTYWFAWSAHYPGTEVSEPGGSHGTPTAAEKK